MVDYDISKVSPRPWRLVDNGWVKEMRLRWNRRNQRLFRGMVYHAKDTKLPIPDDYVSSAGAFGGAICEDDMAHIVHCVNHHDAVIRTLCGLCNGADWLLNGFLTEEDKEMFSDMLKDAIAILRAAKGDGDNG